MFVFANKMNLIACYFSKTLFAEVVGEW